MFSVVLTVINFVKKQHNGNRYLSIYQYFYEDVCRDTCKCRWDNYLLAR